MGSDLTHIICERDAASVIKSYDPNLMVHPYLFDSGKPSHDKDEEMMWVGKIRGVIDRMDAVVIGPGLGRDQRMLKSVGGIIEYIVEEKKGEIPVVIDADGLYLVGEDKGVQALLRRVPEGRVVLTPNVIEFKRLYDALGCDGTTEEQEEQGIQIAKNLNCVVVQKGVKDVIYGCNGEVIVNSQAGSNKRVGGQGDTLTGTIGCLLGFSKIMSGREHSGTRPRSWIEYSMLSSYGGCSVTRECSRVAFAERHRAMQTTDVNEKVGVVFDRLFGAVSTV